MAKLTNPAARAANSVHAAQARVPARRVDAAWSELAEHVLLETLPVAAIGVELTRSLRAGRIPLRAVLLVAVLAI
jgi:hypothetical protein